MGQNFDWCDLSLGTGNRRVNGQGERKTMTPTSQSDVSLKIHCEDQATTIL